MVGFFLEHNDGWNFRHSYTFLLMKSILHGDDVT